MKLRQDGEGFVHLPPCPFAPIPAPATITGLLSVMKEAADATDVPACPMAPYAEAIERQQCPGCGALRAHADGVDPGPCPFCPPSDQPERPPQTVTMVETAAQLAVRLDREAHELGKLYRSALQNADAAWRVIGGRP